LILVTLLAHLHMKKTKPEKIKLEKIKPEKIKPEAEAEADRLRGWIGCARICYVILVYYHG